MFSARAHRSRSSRNWCAPHYLLLISITVDNPQRQQGERIDEEVVNLPPEIFGRSKAPAGTWGSCIRIIDPVEAKTVNVIELEDNEAASSL